MFKHEKQLFHPVEVEKPNPQYAALLQEQLGGANGELKAALQYMSQSFRIKNPEIKDLFLDIAAEELGHLEMVATTINLLNGHDVDSSKVPEGERAEFFRWLYDLEYDRMGLPRPDLVVLLDMPVELSEQLMRKREQSTGTHADIHERNEDYLKKCRDVALHAAKYYGWRTVSCAKDGAIRGVEDIHEEVYAIVKSCLED